MKKLSKYSVVTILGLMALLVLCFIIVHLSSLNNIFSILEDEAILDGGVNYEIYRNNAPSMHVVVFIFSIIVALLSLSALIINVVLRKNVKFRRVYLHICLYIVSIILLFMLSFYLYSNISMLNMEKIMYNASYSDNIYINANVVYGITSLILPFAVANLIFAFLAFLFVKSLVSITVEDSEMSVVESQQATEVSSTKQKLMQEIQDLKDSLEIEDLKSEYKNLYKKYSQKTKED